MEVDTDKVGAEYADGMLRVTLPKLGQDTPRQISIQTA
jgi:HSP20 family molecular chaperone IbpA